MKQYKATPDCPICAHLFAWGVPALIYLAAVWFDAARGLI